MQGEEGPQGPGYSNPKGMRESDGDGGEASCGGQKTITDLR